MTGVSLADLLVPGNEVESEWRHVTDFGLRMNEYSFIIVHWHGLKLNGFDKVTRR
jgi:hypothetical protein